MRTGAGFILLIVVTAVASGWAFERYVDHRSALYGGSERIVPAARYARFNSRFNYGRREAGQGVGRNRGGEAGKYGSGGLSGTGSSGAAGGVPADFCAPAARAIPATAHIVATIGETSRSSGSGTIISGDGYIVTNHHVIAGADDIRVTLNNRKELSARLVGSDATADLAVLKVDAKDLPFLVWGNSNDVKVGQWVLAVGYPFSLESTVTAGIISAKGESLVPSNRRDSQESFIQTDAAVNFGNSGGPLIDLSGDIVGINAAMATPTGVYTGYSFAVPANIARKIVRDIIENGGVKGR